MQRGYIDPVEAGADIERLPVFSRSIVIEPVAHIGWQTWQLQRGMLADRQRAELVPQVRPGCLKPVARFAKIQTACICLEKLQPPAQGQSQTQGPLMVETAVIEVAR